MMLKEKSSPWACLKYLYVLPLAVIAVSAFARPEISEKVEEISAVKVNDLTTVLQEESLKDTVKVKAKANPVSVQSQKADEETVIFEVVEQEPKYPGGMDALHRYISDKVAEVGQSLGKGKVIVGFTVSATGKVKDVHVRQSDLSSLNDAAIRIVSGMPDWNPGMQRNRPVDVKFFVPVRFSSGLEVRGLNFHNTGKKPLLIIDGKEANYEGIEGIDPNIIESVSILKDSTAINVYGKRGADGVIIVSTKRAQAKDDASKSQTKDFDGIVVTDKEPAPDFLVTGTVIDELGQPKAGVSIIIPNTYHGTITDKDGNFKIKAKKGNELFFSFVGCKSVKRVVASTMKVRMEQEVFEISF